jgi:hypothetical protein
MPRLLFVLLFLMPLQVNAMEGYFEHGYGLLIKCEKTLGGEGDSSIDPQTLYHTGLCGGYIGAIHDSVKDMRLHDLIKEDPYCMPVGITRGQLVGIVVNYLKDNPESLNLSASSSVLTAFSESFACRE